MKMRRVEACCILSADGKVLRGAAAEALAPRAVRAWIQGIRRQCGVILRPESADRGALAAAIRGAGGTRILVDGGPEVLHTLAPSGLLTRLHAAFLPVVVGGAAATTLLGPPGLSLLRRSVPLRLLHLRVAHGAAMATYGVSGPDKSASVRRRPRLQASA